jgi:hypothetical protein
MLKVSMTWKMTFQRTEDGDSDEKEETKNDFYQSDLQQFTIAQIMRVNHFHPAVK